MEFPGEREFREFVKNNSHLGYGFMMQAISQAWQQSDPVGAFTVGPCYKQVEVYGEYFHLVDENTRQRELIIRVRDNLWTWAMNLKSHRLTREEYGKLKEILQPLFDEAKALEAKQVI
ncbi:hypothetical protein EDM56_10580 [Brevibacillus fluminis]|uniref:Uncharacterized protein n=1 Tax=Brevibacillus fluminis TaxID=511487 RepID=A0A3M8DNE5_9BACL|nr:hypothetical protein [Brevibacillus fluminis]RNB89622.1 hypothetical protein EDM56_10580 [Brevibacillus fluminis]